MDKKIFVSSNAKQELRTRFNCTQMMVWKALNFKSDSELARKIRFSALQYYDGVANFPISVYDTVHRYDSMTQMYGQHFKLVVSRKSGNATVYVDGVAEKEIKQISISELMKLQRELALRASI